MNDNNRWLRVITLLKHPFGLFSGVLIGVTITTLVSIWSHYESENNTSTDVKGPLIEAFVYPYETVTNTDGLTDQEKEVIQAVDNFYLLILNERFNDLGMVISSNLDVTLAEIVDYYKSTYMSSNLRLSNFKVSTIDLGDNKITDTVGVRVDLTFKTPSGFLEHREALTLKKEDNWLITGVKSLD